MSVCLSFCVVCKEAKADLAFLVDGSWSIGDDNFMKITRFLYSTMGSLDLIGSDGTQVSSPHFEFWASRKKIFNKFYLFNLTVAPFSQMHNYNYKDF